MKSSVLSVWFLLFTINTLAVAQIPLPKTKEEKKKQSITDRLEEALPVDIAMPSAKVGNQDIKSFDDAKKLVTETLPDLGLKISKKAQKVKKELTKNKNAFDGKTYEGIAVQKQIVKKGVGERLNYEEFYYLKIDQRVDPFVNDIYWYDERSGKILNVLTKNTKRSHILHGPYKRWVGPNVVEEGHYYLGTKHQRWIQYDKNFNIIDKQVWNKGFMADSRKVYYDADQKRLKEVIPHAYGKVSGPYYSFYENGAIEMAGVLDDSVAVGRWVEYYETKRAKKEIQYGKHRFDTAEPYILREYDEGGKLIYEAKK